MVDQLTEEQVEEFQEAFDLFDRENNGQMKTAELAHCMRALGHFPGDTDIQDHLKEVDPDNTGVIEFPEFLMVMARQLAECDPDDLIRSAFRVFDRDGTGFIGTKDLRKILTNMGDKLTHEEVDEMIKEGDLNNQKKINYAEFVTLMSGR